MSSQSPSAFDWNKARIVHRGNLPHLRQDNVVYFVTFRLGDSLPAERVAELREQRDRWLKSHPSPLSAEQQHEYHRIWTSRLEDLLDAGHGDCVLKAPECREILESVLRHDDGSKYWLGEFVIMPNHVHALLQLLEECELSDVIKAWKSVSSRQIGRKLNRRGSLWMDEYFDHAVRDDESLIRFVRYIQKNPRSLTTGTFSVGRGTLQS